MGHMAQLPNDGYCFFPKFLEGSFVCRLLKDLDWWIEYAARVRAETGLGNTMAQVWPITYLVETIQLLWSLSNFFLSTTFLKVIFFEGPYILNSVGEGAGNLLMPSKDNYAHVTKISS